MKLELWNSQHSKKERYKPDFKAEKFHVWNHGCYDFSGVGAPVLFSILIPQQMIQTHGNNAISYRTTVSRLKQFKQTLRFSLYCE